MEYSRLPVANPSIVFREEFDDWALLFDPDTGESYGVNPVGAHVWKELDGSKTFAELIAGLRSAFDDVPETVSDEVAAFLDDLVDRGYAGFEVNRQ
ncbi:MAG: Coenzyme PQQ synthesis protein D (PqqD) [Methanoculleus marisnigri]|jgi:Coenzyme PQQ synthesis protein D (PqqD).|uniref:Coenzyme PQQ synthesis protein D (PqqD) n=1 Tax=Methanoculleus marisnigri TaxID=2198 RepID=A0A101GST8_9EURY|nr:SynChlorMet cassette protein ScmD [Methanoculleus marisnigri]KUK63932.1 MAG: Coenzyme PQQ synthesis protein D (PqqD) [Methanoculleus marisnigri]